jgi:hypothetical protein
MCGSATRQGACDGACSATVKVKADGIDTLSHMPWQAIPTLFVWLINHQPVISQQYFSLRKDLLVYQPPASSTFISEQTSRQESANNIFLSQKISHQPQTNTLMIDPY